ncbi:MAG TPA: hypothetical protein VIU61_09855 [Kofleriaceae bacterium]
MRVAAIAIVILGLAPPAFADAKAAAKKKIEIAAEHHAAGRYKEALNELTIAYTLSPMPDILYAIAQVHVKLGDCTQAITFYERFLGTRPPDEPADAAREAIEVCRTQPPRASGQIEPTEPPAPLTPPEPAPDVAPPAPAPAPAPVQVDQPSTWYKDKLGLGLVGGGVVSGVISLVMYRSATADLDAAEAAPTYPEHVDLVESAKGKRTIAAVLAVGGVALVGAGAVRFVMVRSRESSSIAVVPTTRGGFVTWSGSW